MPQVEDLMDKPNRFYHVHYDNNDVSGRSTENADSEDTDKDMNEDEDDQFNPKATKIFDTSMFKSGLNFRNAINEKVTVDKDATKGLVSYPEYLRGAVSSPK